MPNKLPKLTNTYFTERAGVVAVAGIFNQIHCAWRETPNADVGIDGQVEYVDENGFCTGKILAVQIKSGQSYFKNATNEYIPFSPEEKHRKYWHDFPIPVLLVLYSMERQLAYWTDARRQLRSPNHSENAPLLVPTNQVLDEIHRESLFETAGPIDGAILPIEVAAVAMATNHLAEPGFDVSFLDLFAIGIIDVGRKIFFSMGTASEIAEARAVENGLSGFVIGDRAQEFCRRYVRFLVSQSLIHYDFSDFLIDWEDRFLQPTFIAPLTRRGEQLLDYLQKLAGNDDTALTSTVIAVMEEYIWSYPQRLKSLLTLRRRILDSDTRAGKN